MFSLRSGIDIYLLNNPKLVLKLYDCMIKPILLYGAEVWGQQFYTHLQNNLKNIESIEFGKLQSKICKQLLGDGKFISNLAARAGLGRIPVCFYIMKCILRYWIKIENSNQSKLLFQCLLSEKKLCYDGIPSWFTGVLKLIKMVDENCTMILTKDDIKRIVIKLEEKCKELALSNIRSDITVKGTSNELRTFAKIKNSIVIEDYLIYNMSWSQKKVLAKIRLNDHKLRKETSVSSRIQKGHGATDHQGHLIMQHPPSPIKGINRISWVCKHRQLLLLCTQDVIRYCVIGVNAWHQWQWCFLLSQ